MGSKNFQNNTMFVLLCFAIALVCSVFGFTFSNFLFIFTISIIFVMKICRKLFRNVHGAIIIIKWLGFFRFFSFFLFFSLFCHLTVAAFTFPLLFCYHSLSLLHFVFLFSTTFSFVCHAHIVSVLLSVQVNQNSMSAVTKHRRVYTRHLDESEKCGGALASFIYLFIFLSQFFFHQNL